MEASAGARQSLSRRRQARRPPSSATRHAGRKYVVGFVVVPAVPLRRPCRSRDAGGGRERPPFWTPWISTGEHRHVYADAPLRRGGGSRPNYPCVKAGEPAWKPALGTAQPRRREASGGVPEVHAARIGSSGYSGQAYPPLHGVEEGRGIVLIDVVVVPEAGAAHAAPVAGIAEPAGRRRIQRRFAKATQKRNGVALDRSAFASPAGLFAAGKVERTRGCRQGFRIVLREGTQLITYPPCEIDGAAFRLLSQLPRSPGLFRPTPARSCGSGSAAR